MKRRRRHVSRGRWRRRLPVLVALTSFIVVGLVGAAYAGYRYDRAHAARLLPGVTIAGVDVGGMTRAQAKKALEPVTSRILGRTIKVRIGTKASSLTSKELGTRVGVTTALDAAFGIAERYDWPVRVYHLLFDKPVSKRVRLPVSYSSDSVSRFVKDVATRVDRSPRDAGIEFVDGELIATPSKVGRSLNQDVAKKELLRALRAKRASSSVKFRLVPLHPEVTEDDLGDTILVRLSQNRLYHYEGLSLRKKYDVATGTPSYPTPQGDFEIINKRVYPTWVNPAPDGWGASLPESIGPGPGNPLGTRALDLDAPGIRIHGTYDDSSIGTYASHGCIRMHIPESEELFDRVDVGTAVIIAQ